MHPSSNPLPYRPRRTRRFWWLALLVAAGLAYWQWGGTRAPDAKTKPATLVRIATVSRSVVPQTLEVVGSVVPYESVAIKTRVESQVVKVHFKDGATVHKGDLLFTLDDRELAAQETQLMANITRDQAQLTNAQKRAGRARALAASGFATRETRDDSVANASVAAANLRASQAALTNIRTARSYTRITAPISGRTGTINVTVGNTVRPGDSTPLVTINQLSPIRVQAALPQTVLAELRSAMKKGSVRATAVAEETGEAKGSHAEGALDYLDNAVDTATGTVVTRARFDNKQETLWPGMFVTLTLAYGDNAPVPNIPEQAIQHSPQGDFVYVIADEKAKRTPVTVARIAHGVAVVSEGVTEGDTVAVDGLMSLKEGAAVRVKDPAAEGV